MKHWPFTVVDVGGRPKLQVEYKNETKTFTPEEISSMVLTKMKETAEAYLGQVSTRIYDERPVCLIFSFLFPRLLSPPPPGSLPHMRNLLAS
jgi:hypothetical protein